MGHYGVHFFICLQVVSNHFRSLQTSLLGFTIFKVILRDETFTPVDNVLLQTAAVATATMPLAGGFVGIIPGTFFIYFFL